MHAHPGDITQCGIESSSTSSFRCLKARNCLPKCSKLLSIHVGQSSPRRRGKRCAAHSLTCMAVLLVRMVRHL